MEKIKVKFSGLEVGDKFTLDSYSKKEWTSIKLTINKRFSLFTEQISPISSNTDVWVDKVVKTPRNEIKNEPKVLISNVNVIFDLIIKETEKNKETYQSFEAQSVVNTFKMLKKMINNEVFSEVE